MYMKLAAQIKQHLDTISGKKRLTILNKFVKENYKEQNTQLRNVSGEYTPKMAMEHLRLLITYLKNLCANKGKSFFRYYSFNKMQEIESVLALLAGNFENLSATTGKSAMRNIFISSIDFIEQLKNLLGPFADLKFDTAIERIAQEISDYQETLQQLQDTAKTVAKQSNAIQKHFDKSEKASSTFQSLTKETASMQKQLESHIIATKQLFERTTTVTNQIDRLQTRFEEKVKNLDAFEEDMIAMRSRIEEEYKNTIDQSREYEVIAARMEQIHDQSKSLLNQARHVLNASQGTGFIESYRELYENASKMREFLPWSICVGIGFAGSVLFIALSIINIQGLASIMDIFIYPVILAQLLAVPVVLFCFFFSLIQLKKKQDIKKRYHTRLAALETYLNVSEHLPYDSPEQMHTASKIMRYLEEDFHPVAVRNIYHQSNPSVT